MTAHVTSRNGRLVRTLPPAELLAELALGSRSTTRPSNTSGKPRSRTNRRLPRKLAVLAAITALIAGVTGALAATVTDIGTYDLTVPNKNASTGLVSLGNASVEYIGSSANNQASGTGLFDPFVRVQGSPTEQGFNTDAATTFDAKTGKWTHAIKVNAIPVVSCDGSGTGPTCWELFVDINDSNNAKRISLNDVQIWFTDSATTTDGTGTTFTGFASPATLEYQFTGDILINDVNQGSGRGDLRYLVPTAGHTWDASTWFVLYSLWGTTSGTAGNAGTGGYSSDGGFEEWKVRKAPSVSIVKTANPVGPVSAGTAIGFDITVSNTGAADATNVVISDPLPPGGDLNWSLSPAFTGCSIMGPVGSQHLDCTFATLAAGTSKGPIHITSATTQADCALVSNTATVASENDGGGSSTDSVTIECAAIVILKESTKAENPLVQNAGAVFSVTGPGSYSASVTDTVDGTLGDEDNTIGSVCVSGLAPGTYTVNETAAPSGYGDATEVDVSVEAVNGTNCTSNLPTGTGVVTFTNSPLYDVQVNFRDGGSGETSATIVCDIDPADSTTPATGWDTTSTYTGRSAPQTFDCTITVDP
jgi:uncharacterized repeat protein (TIGR01451 family)